MSEKITIDQSRHSVSLWTTQAVTDSLSDHAKKNPAYNACIKELEVEEDGQSVKINIELKARGRNEFYQNLALFLINALKQ